jgi:hypothetical protein
MPNASATLAPPLLGVAVTVAELPAESVDAVAVIVGVGPAEPVAPVAPVAPAGIPNASDRLAPLLLEVPTTDAELPADSVVVFPTVMLVYGGPAGPVAPVPPGAAAGDAVTDTAEAAVTVAITVSPVPATTDGPDCPLTVTVTLTEPSR